MPFGIGPMEIVIVLVLAMLVLGPKRLPDAARSLGRGVRDFRGAVTDDSDDAVVGSAASRERAA